MKPPVVAQGLISYSPVVTSLRPSALCMMKSMPRLIIHRFCAAHFFFFPFHHFVVLHNRISKSSNTHKKSIKEAWIISVKEKCDKRNSSQCTSGGVEIKKAQTGEIVQKQDSAHIEHHLFFSFFLLKNCNRGGWTRHLCSICYCTYKTTPTAQPPVIQCLYSTYSSIYI